MNIKKTERISQKRLASDGVNLEYFAINKNKYNTINSTRQTRKNSLSDINDNINLQQSQIQQQLQSQQQQSQQQQFQKHSLSDGLRRFTDKKMYIKNDEIKNEQSLMSEQSQDGNIYTTGIADSQRDKIGGRTTKMTIRKKSDGFNTYRPSYQKEYLNTSPNRVIRDPHQYPSPINTLYPFKRKIKTPQNHNNNSHMNPFSPNNNSYNNFNNNNNNNNNSYNSTMYSSSQRFGQKNIGTKQNYPNSLLFHNQHHQNILSTTSYQRTEENMHEKKINSKLVKQLRDAIKRTKYNALEDQLNLEEQKHLESRIKNELLPKILRLQEMEEEDRNGEQKKDNIVISSNRSPLHHNHHHHHHQYSQSKTPNNASTKIFQPHLSPHSSPFSSYINQNNTNNKFNNQININNNSTINPDDNNKQNNANENNTNDKDKKNKIISKDDISIELLMIIKFLQNRSEYLSTLKLMNKEKSIDIMTDLLKLATELDDIDLFLNVMDMIVQTAVMFSDYKLALIILNMMKITCEMNHNTQKKITLYRNYAFICKRLGYYEDAVRFLKKALQYIWLEDDKDQEVQLYDDLGLVFFHMVQIDQAKLFHSKSVQSFNEPIDNILREMSSRNLQKFIQSFYPQIKSLDQPILHKLLQFPFVLQKRDQSEGNIELHVENNYLKKNNYRLVKKIELMNSQLSEQYLIQQVLISPEFQDEITIPLSKPKEFSPLEFVRMKKVNDHFVCIEEKELKKGKSQPKFVAPKNRQKKPVNTTFYLDEDKKKMDLEEKIKFRIKQLDNDLKKQNKIQGSAESVIIRKENLEAINIGHLTTNRNVEAFTQFVSINYGLPNKFYDKMISYQFNKHNQITQSQNATPNKQFQQS